MELSKKLNQWQQAKLIDSTTADKIIEFEKQHSRPIALWALGGLGAFAIILGLVSIIASNWMQTPNWLKLTTDLILCLVIALSLYRVVSLDNSNPRNQWLREILVIFYYGFTLASMALIGQTYQLGGSIASLLLVWTLFTLPLVLLGRGKFLTVLWIVGTAVTYALNINAFDDIIRQFISQQYLGNALLGALIILSPLLFMLLSRLPWLVNHRPIMAGELSRYSWLAIIIGGWFSHFLWYESSPKSVDDIKSLQLLLTLCLIATTAMLMSIPKLYSSSSPHHHLMMRTVLITVFLISATAVWHEETHPVIGAIINITYMLVLAWAALTIQSIKLFNSMTALICIRLLFIYFEVFGSMLATGIGLVMGGLFTLSVVWLWFKKSASIARHFGLSPTSKSEQDEQ